MCVWGGDGVHAMECVEVRGQLRGSRFSPFTTCIPEAEPRLVGLAASAFTYELSLALRSMRPLFYLLNFKFNSKRENRIQ